MASSSLLLSTNVFLTHFFGDWAKEMIYPIGEQLTPGVKVLDSKLGVRAGQFQNPSFILSLNGRATGTSGEVLAGSLAWSGSFECAFEHNTEQIRAVCGINSFATAYHLKPGETFITPAMIWVWSNHGFGDMSRKFHDWARDFGMRNGHEPRPVLLNNWESTGFDFDFNRIARLFGPAKELGAELFLPDDGWFGTNTRALTTTPVWGIGSPIARGCQTASLRSQLQRSSADCALASGWSRKWSTPTANYFMIIPTG